MRELLQRLSAANFKGKLYVVLDEEEAYYLEGADPNYRAYILFSGEHYYIHKSWAMQYRFKSQSIDEACMEVFDINQILTLDIMGGKTC